MAAYLGLLRRLIEQELVYPASAQRLGLTGQVEVVFGIEADGTLETGHLDVVGGSEEVILRDAALQTIRGIGRFPPPPRGAMRVSVPVLFVLR